MNFPGDLTDDEKQESFEELRLKALAKWGEQRTLALEDSLRDASAAVARLDLLRFSRDDSPAFYLHETVPNANE